MESSLRNGLNQVTSIEGAPVGYDADQNATDVLGNAYGYDAVNRLTTATAAGGPGASSFTYDPYDRLITTTTGAATTRFQYAGQQLAAEYDAATGALLRRHIPGLGLDGTIVSYAGSGTTNAEWLLADERGSVIALTDGLGAAFNINRYDDYGVPAAGNMGRFQYTGQQWLAEAGAYHYRARTYLPQIGRFLQTDSIGYLAGANLYAYVGADPVNYADPSGECPPCAVGAFVGGVVGGGMEAYSQYRQYGEVRDYGRVAIQTGVGALSGATGAGVGTLAAKVVAPVLAGAAGGLVGGASGGSAGAGLSESWREGSTSGSVFRAAIGGGYVAVHWAL